MGSELIIGRLWLGRLGECWAEACNNLGRGTRDMHRRRMAGRLAMVVRLGGHWSVIHFNLFAIR